MKITLEPYDHSCHDGCCGTFGWDIFVDRVRIGDIEGDDVEWLVERLNLHFKKIKNIEWREPLKYEITICDTEDSSATRDHSTEGNAFPSVNPNNSQP